MEKKFKQKLKKPIDMLKICKTTLNNNIIAYNDSKRDLHKLASQLQVVVGEEVRTPMGRGIVKRWREEDSMVEIGFVGLECLTNYKTARVNKCD